MALTLNQAADLAQSTPFRRRCIVGAIRLSTWAMAQSDATLEALQVTALGARQVAERILSRPHADDMQARVALIVASHGPLVSGTPSGDVDQSTISDSDINAALQASLPALVSASAVQRGA